MDKKVAVELARILGKLEAGKKLTAIETLMVLPYLYVQDIEERIQKARMKKTSGGQNSKKSMHAL